MQILGITLFFSILAMTLYMLAMAEEASAAIPDLPLEEPCSSCKGMVVHRIYGAYYQYEDDYCMRCGKTTNFEVI